MRVGLKLDQGTPVMLAIMILLGLLGCQTSEKTKDKIFISDVKRIGATLQPGQSAVVPLPLLEKNELLIAMNGGWGSIEPSAHVSKELATRVTVALGYDEGGYYNFVIIFASDQKIISDTKVLDESFGLPQDQLITNAKIVVNNAKVAHSGTRAAVLRCVSRKTNEPHPLNPRDTDDLWNPRCRIELVMFK